MQNCIFCQIVAGTSPSHKVWENDQFVAFLSIFPNTQGVTVVIPKEHHDSYIFNVPEEVMIGLIQASKQVAQKIDAAFDDVARTGMVFEGFGVNHLHAKLFPLHGTAPMEKWEKKSSDIQTYFDQYQGYISSHDYRGKLDYDLAEVAQKIRTKK